MKSDTSRVAVLVPLSLRPTLTADEEISLAHLLHFLGRYDKYLLVPKGMRVERPGFRVMPLSTTYFGSPHGQFTDAAVEVVL